MASLQEAYSRYITHYIQVIQQASQLYKGRQDKTLAGLALFDAERNQIQSIWDWLCARTISDQTDDWLIECARYLAIVGYSRYSLWSELVPTLNRAIDASQRRSLPAIRAELLVRLAQVHI